MTAFVAELDPVDRAWAREIYEHLHRNPELSMQEHRTADHIADQLTALGVDSSRCGGTGVVGLIENGPGPVVAFRADTDGLPVAERTGLPYASTATGTLPDGSEVPVMHACGHDTHVTSLLTATKILLERRDEWSGTLVLVFQPGEETAAGARAMVDDGLWDRMPRPDVVLGQHVMPLAHGSVMIRPGVAMCMADSWRVTLHGRQSHGSQPQDSIDPIVLGAHIITRIQGIVSRETDPRRPAVVTVGTFHAGLKENIIPERAEFALNVRTADEETRAHVLAALRRIIEAEAAASAAPDPEITELYTFPLCSNDPAATARVREVLAATLGEDNVVDGELLMGSEDVGHLWESIGVPGVYWFFGGFDPQDGKPPVNHSPEFAPVADPTLATGTRAALATILAWLGTSSE